ncbi:MAG TPA: hypothetical protein VD968_08625, partial [Pyrinomonadaceae bacterium]|nr:hypothetical protein [Pyrinomonadaceae bacterium]
MTERLVVFGADEDRLTRLVAERLRAHAGEPECAVVSRGASAVSHFGGAGAAVYLALARSKDGVALDLDDAERVFRQLASAGARKLVLVTSAAVYGASPHNTGLLT